MDKAAYITERFANGETKAIIGRPVTDTNTKTKAPLRQFMDKRRGLRVVCRMARIDVRNAGAKGDLMGRQGQGFAQPHTIPKAGAIDPAETFLFKALSQLKRSLAAPGYSGKAHGWFGWHVYLLGGIGDSDCLARLYRKPRPAPRAGPAGPACSRPWEQPIILKLSTSRLRAQAGQMAWAYHGYPCLAPVNWSKLHGVWHVLPTALRR